MGTLLFIGSAVADVVVRIPHLPVTGGDLHVSDQHVSLGGCACNAYLAARGLHLADCTLFAPVGGGVWGDWVERALSSRGISSAAPRVSAENGCCYCLVEDTGERTFLSHHGAEYRFDREWFDRLDTAAFDGVYLCGLEVEEATGPEIIAALESRPPQSLYFAPGPRLTRISPALMARVLALHPVLHLNQEEAASFTRTDDVAASAEMLRRLTGSDVIITLGADGAYLCAADDCGVVPGVPAHVVDTIGAGDAHVGALMAARAAGRSLREAVTLANRVSAAVVGVSGAELPQAAWQALLPQVGAAL